MTFALVVGLSVLLSRRRAIFRTTLASAWWWSLAALIAWCGVEIAAIFSAEGPGRTALAPLQLAAVTLGFCPVVSLLGAKRPQHKAWNFVVLSLWAIVALPAAENFLLHRGQRVDVGAARGWFLWALLLLGPICYSATRYWLASLMLAAGQFVAFSRFLAIVHRDVVIQPGVMGLLLSVAAIVVAWLASRRTTAVANRYDRLWLDFRDTFGLLWALRVQERLNAAAKLYGWNIELLWDGFLQPDSAADGAAIDPAIEPALRITFKALLRRFVAGPWISDRLKLAPERARDVSP